MNGPKEIIAVGFFEKADILGFKYDRRRRITIVSLNLTIGSCVNTLGPLTHVLKRGYRRKKFIVTAVYISPESVRKARCLAIHKRKKDITLRGDFLKET